MTVHGPVAVSAGQFRAMMHMAPSAGVTTKSLHLWQSYRLNKPNGDGLAYGVGCNCDPQFAVSLTNGVGLCSENMGFYLRGGTPLAEQSIQTFFQPLSGALPAGHYFDNRLIFDDVRQRFWVTSMVTPTSGSPAGSVPKMFMAISQTSDATKGWYYYWTNANAPNCTGCGIDFSNIGISGKRFLVTDRAWDNEHGSYAHVMHFDAVAAANGGSVSGWQWWTLTNPDGSNIDIFTAPVRSHDSTTAAYFVGHYASNKLLVWTLPDGQNDPGYMYSTQYTLPAAFNAYGQILYYPMWQDGYSQDVLATNTPTQGGSYAYRAGKLVVAWHEKYSASSVFPGVRVVALDVSNHTTSFDVRLGYNIPSAWSLGYPAVDIAYGSNMIGAAFTLTYVGYYPSIAYASITPSGYVSGYYLGYQGTGYLQTCQQGHNGRTWSDVSTCQSDPINGSYSSFWAANQFGSGSGTKEFEEAVVNFATTY